MLLLICNDKSTAISWGPIKDGWVVICIDNADNVGHALRLFSRNVQEFLQRLGRALQLLHEERWFVKAQ